VYDIVPEETEQLFPDGTLTGGGGDWPQNSYSIDYYGDWTDWNSTGYLQWIKVGTGAPPP